MRKRCCESKLCVSSIHPLCSQLTIQSPKDYLLCQKIIVKGHILAVHERGFMGSSKAFHAGPPLFLCVLSFHFSFNIVNYSSLWMCELHLQLFRPFECVTLQTHSGIISHFPLHQQFCAGFRNPWMLLLDSFFIPCVSQIL